MEKGILGVKRDPKNPVLCFVNGEEWPSDDSKDEDFVASVEKPKKTLTNDGVLGRKGSSKSGGDYEDGPPTDVPIASEAPRVGKFVIKRTSKANDEGTEKDNFVFRPKRQPKEKMGEDEKQQMKRGRKKKTKAANGKETSEECVIGPWGSVIPFDILLLIFKYVVRSEGVLPFLKRASLVCSMWKQAAQHSSLWFHVDVSKPKVTMTEAELLTLCRKHFGNVRELNLGGWGTNLTGTTINIVSDTCPHLTSLNLSGCRKVTGSILRSIVDKCPKLTGIDISQISGHVSADSPVSSNSVRYVVNKLGDRLVRLSIAGNILIGLPGIITMISESCHELREFDLSNVATTDRGIMTIHVERLQQGCSKLRVLRLANITMRLSSVSLTDQAASPGFPELEELSIAKINSNFDHGLDDASMERILKSSHKLKLLDVRGCSRISASGLVRIPAWDLEHLFLSQCSGAITPDLELVMQKWAHSLVQVDLSWNNQSGEVVDSAVKALAFSSLSPVRNLDLCGSAVSFKPVKSVLCNCSNLNVLNLSSCRGLPRGIKRLYRDVELVKLRTDVEEKKFD